MGGCYSALPNLAFIISQVADLYLYIADHVDVLLSQRISLTFHGVSEDKLCLAVNVQNYIDCMGYRGYMN